MDKSKRKEMEFQLRRREILKYAERTFAAKGFYDTTMAEIADASGFAIGTLYHFFDGKENLFMTMISEKLDVMYSEIRGTVIASETIMDKIENLFKSHFYFAENNVDFCSLFIRGEVMTPSMNNTALRDKITAEYAKHVDFIEDIMRKGTEIQCLKVMEPRNMALAFIGMTRSYFYDWMISKRETPLSDKVNSAIAIFLTGVKSEVAR